MYPPLERFSYEPVAGCVCMIKRGKGVTTPHPPNQDHNKRDIESNPVIFSQFLQFFNMLS